MKIYDDIRQKTSPHKAAVIGWAGFFAPLFIAGVVMMGAGEDRGTAAAALIIGFVIAALFVVYWAVFGRCLECGHMPRPFEEYCSQCGASLNKTLVKKDVTADSADGGQTVTAEKPGVLESSPANARDLTETQVSSEDLFNGVVLHLFKDKIQLPDGRPAERELIRHVGAVCVVPVTDDGKIVVERQYRYAVGQTMIEIPAGKLDYPGEDRLEAAKRELREETGCTADRWTDLGLYLTAPAFSDEKISMYMAEGLHKGEQDLDEDEFLDVYEVPLDELVEDVMSGKITDAKTQAGILKAARILGSRL